jgi:hypothetical protein
MNDFYTLANMVAPTTTGSPTITSVRDVDGGTNVAHIKAWWYQANTGGAQTAQTTETGTHDEEKSLTALVLGGVDLTGNPIDDSSGVSGTADPQDASAVSPTTSNAFVVICNTSGAGANAGGYTVGSGATEQAEINNGGQSGVIATKQLITSGSTGTFSVDPGTSTPYASVTIAIKTASGGPTSDLLHALPPHILEEILQAWIDYTSEATTTQVTAETGLASIGLVSTATAVHVAPRTGGSFAGVSSSSTAKKVVAQTGMCTVGGVSRATALKKTAQIGTSSVGLSDTSTDKKVAVEIGLAVVGVASTSLDKKVAIETGRSAAGAVSTSVDTKIAVAAGRVTVGFTDLGTDVKKIAQTGLATVGFDALHSGATARQVAATCFVGVSSFAVNKKVAVSTGLVTVGFTSQGVAARRTGQSGRIIVGTASSGRASKTVSLDGRVYGSVLSTGSVGLPPPEPTLMTVLYDIATILRDYTRNGLASTIAGVPANMRICIVPGLQAWDECTCGALIISVPRIYGSRSFPQEGFTNDQDPCGLPYIVADYTITILRCAPMPKSPNQLPTCDELDAAAQIWFDDADAVRRAIAAAVQTMKNDDTILDYTLRDQPAVGPSGGCVGSEYHLFVGVKNVWGPC